MQAAKIYPANYWLSMLNLPDTSAGLGISSSSSRCMLCHQIGIKSTRAAHA